MTFGFVFSSEHFTHDAVDAFALVCMPFFPLVLFSQLRLRQRRVVAASTHTLHSRIQEETSSSRRFCPGKTPPTRLALNLSKYLER